MVTGGKWDAAVSTGNAGEIRAAMPYYPVKKYGFNFLLQPQLTPYLGPLLFYPPDLKKNTSLYSFQNRHLNALIQKLPHNTVYQQFSFTPAVDNWYPFYLNGYRQSTRYTFILKNIKNHEEVFAGFSNTVKRQIGKAQKSITVTGEDDICSVFGLLTNSNQKEKLKLGLGRSKLKALDHELKKRGQRKILIARDRQNQLVAGLYLVWDKRQAYLLALGSDYGKEQYHAPKLLIWEAIKTASAYVDVFDFEGSMIPGVERLYRNFGGVKTPYFEVKKYKNRFIKAAFSLLNK